MGKQYVGGMVYLSWEVYQGTMMLRVWPDNCQQENTGLVKQRGCLVVRRGRLVLVGAAKEVYNNGVNIAAACN